MGMIKSSLELALERTASMEADHKGLRASEIKAKARQAAAHFMDDPSSVELKSLIASQAKGDQASFRAACAEVFLSYVQLPRDRNSKMPLDQLGAGLSAISTGLGADKRIRGLLDQVSAFAERFNQDCDQLEEALKRQFAPKLRQKEQEIAKRTGQEISIDPLRDPEFQALYGKNLGQLKAQYQGALSQAKEDMLAMILS